MGNYANKLLFYANESQKECNEHQMVVQQTTMEDNNICTPILSEKRVLGDPRSVSSGIRRTPIEIKYTSSGENKKTPSAMSKYLQKKQYFETDIYVVMPPLTPKKRHISKSMDNNKQSDFIEVQDSTPNVNVAKSSKIITPIDKERFIILGLDPRSPAADFDRTPILMPKSLALIKARSQENLSHKGSYEVDIYNPKNSCQKIDTAINIPETRLSDTASESLKALDTKEQNGVSSTSLYNSDLNISKSEKEITVIRNLKYISEQRKLLISDKQIVAIDNEEDKNKTEKQDDCENIESNTKIRDDDKIKLWHSLSSEKCVSGKKDEKKLLRKKVSRDDVIITFDKYTTISTSLKPMKTDLKKGKHKRKKKNVKVNVKFNEEKMFTLENKQEIEMYENRIPLGNRSNNNQIQQKLQQLKNRNTAIGTQENTPPSKTYSKKTRNGTQWDPNSTVLI
ncbi:PREDICTED: LOW QUALITY PROTEIN: uncharacterized protein LOC105620163 [Atta cephalotes]|uniref:Uncharacterized protein n=1 Tax=Atta cephalotes TaxID=12957 RepID=A0A158NHQ1_ATTCE|nr:PREDICTED: LOW QUALITY PROTEIN: uncharacterized protein LOC105620163 [Atta cephalotes]